MNNELRVIISGGGTGGHIFPAISIANAIREKCPDAKILFVGAEGRMEMQRVPAAGYEIKGLPIQGFDRKNLLKNVKVLSRYGRASAWPNRLSANSVPWWPSVLVDMPADLRSTNARQWAYLASYKSRTPMPA